MLMNNEKSATARIADLYGAIPAITGKVELVYEGELEGIANVAYMLIGKAIRAEYVNYFPDPERMKKSKQRNPYADILQWFNEGNELDILHTVSQKKYSEVLSAVKGLKTLMKEYVQDTPEEDKLFLMEFILHGLSEYSQISKRKLDGSMKFSDLVGSIFKMDQESKDE
jgi:magnesium chelatase subunit I